MLARCSRIDDVAAIGLGARRAGSLVVAAGVLCAFAPATAQAATAEVVGATLRVAGVGTEANRLTVTVSGAELVVEDLGASLTPGAGCVASGTSARVVCAASGVTKLELDGAEGADRVISRSPLPALVLGGGGDDVLSGGTGADDFRGGPGNDHVTYADRTRAVIASLDGLPNDGEAAEGDVIAADVEKIDGGAANDVLTGMRRPTG